MSKHFFLSDVQQKPGCKTNHLTAAANYIVDKQPDVIICAGDFYDMPSLSSYDRGTKKAEGKRYHEDIEAGIEAMEAFLAPIKKYNKKQKRKKHKQYKPRMVFLCGNHEHRITRHVNANPELDGKLGLHDLKLKEMGWEFYDFTEIVTIDGVAYSHYFYAPNTGRAYGGRATSKLNNVGFSFTQGHQQGLDVAMKHLANGRTIRGLVSGSYYQHFEDYKGPQANDHWQGCIFKTEVKDGDYCLMELSLNYLMKEWL